MDGDEEFRVFNRKGAAYIADGVFGIHGDDMVSGGEGVNCKADVDQQGPEQFVCYKERAKRLLHRFCFGSVNFTYGQVFCGIQPKQSMAMSLQKYVHSIKPITVNKVRKQCPTQTLGGK